RPPRAPLFPYTTLFRSATELLDQAIVTAAGTDGTLGTELVGGPLEHGFAVVIETAHQRRIDRITQANTIEQLPQCGKMLLRLVVQIIRQHWRIDEQFTRSGILAVENSQRISQQAALAVGIEPIGKLLQINHQRRFVLSARSGRANAVQLQRDVRIDTELAP